MEWLGNLFKGVTNAVTGGISSLVSSVLQLLIEIISTLLVQLFTGICSLYINAMASLNSETIETWLGTAASDDMQNTIRGIALALCGLFATWEIVKCFYCYISGEQPQSKPTTILIKLLVFGTLSVTGITLSKTLFDVGIDMFKSLYTVTFESEGWWVNGDSFSGDTISGNFLLNSLWGSDSGGSVGSKIANVFVNGGTELNSSLVNTIIGAALIIFAFINMFKFLINMFEKFAAMIVYMYMAPIALSCGVSTTWKGVASAWFKNFMSQIVMWCIDVWVLYAGLNMMATGVGTLGSTYVLWSAICAGYMKIALHLDEVLKSVGLSVTKTSGNMLDDVLGVAGGVVSGVGAIMTGGTTAGIQKALSGASTAMKAAKTAGGGLKYAGAALKSAAGIGIGVLSDTVSNVGTFAGAWERGIRAPGRAASELPATIQDVKNNYSNHKSEAREERNKNDAMKQVLETGEDVNEASRENGNTAAACSQHNKALKRLDTLNGNDVLNRTFDNPNVRNAVAGNSLKNPTISNVEPVTITNKNGKQIDGFKVTARGETANGMTGVKTAFVTQSANDLKYYHDKSVSPIEASVKCGNKEYDVSVISGDDLMNVNDGWIASDTDEGAAFKIGDSGEAYVQVGNEISMLTNDDEGNVYETKGMMDSKSGNFIPGEKNTSGKFVPNYKQKAEIINKDNQVSKGTSMEDIVTTKISGGFNTTTKQQNKKANRK